MISEGKNLSCTHLIFRFAWIQRLSSGYVPFKTVKSLLHFLLEFFFANENSHQKSPFFYSWACHCYRFPIMHSCRILTLSSILIFFSPQFTCGSFFPPSIHVSWHSGLFHTNIALSSILGNLCVHTLSRHICKFVFKLYMYLSKTYFIL